MKLGLRRTGSRRERMAPGLVVISGLIQFAGVGVSIMAFETAGAETVAWGRITGAALFFLAWRRCVLRRADGSIDWRRYLLVGLFGLSIGLMNLTFYLAVDRIPLGSAVAIEYLGPIALAVITGSGWRTRSGIVAAVVGVFLISWGGLDLGVPSVRSGLILATVCGVFWALYVVFSNRALRLGNGLDNLAWAMVVASIVTLPAGVPRMGDLVSSWSMVGAMIVVVIATSVVPFSLEQIILSSVPASTYSLLMSIQPAVSMVTGVIMLHQMPGIGEIAGLTFISLAVILASSGGKAEESAPVVPDDPVDELPLALPEVPLQEELASEATVRELDEALELVTADAAESDAAEEVAED